MGLRNNAHKPRIKVAWRSFLNGQVMWECETGAMSTDWLLGYGATPKSAYHAWAINRRNAIESKRWSTPIQGGWL